MDNKIICANCGNANLPTDELCSSCGSRLKASGSEFSQQVPPQPSDYRNYPASEPTSDQPGAVTPGMRKCPFCKELIMADAIKCRYCGEYLNQQPAHQPGQPSAHTYVQAAPGQQYPSIQPFMPPQYQSSMPPFIPGLSGFNWGAFTFPFFWSIAMNQSCLLVILSLFPVTSWAVAIYLGIKGNELAWQYRRWSSIEQYKSTLDTWNNCGVIYLIIVSILVIIYWIYFYTKYLVYFIERN